MAPARRGAACARMATSRTAPRSPGTRTTSWCSGSTARPAAGGPGGAAGPPRPVFDLRRRWLSEVTRLDKPISEVLHVSGNNNTSFTLGSTALAAFYNAQTGSNRYLRIVLRSKTNRGFDDMGGSVA